MQLSPSISQPPRRCRPPEVLEDDASRHDAGVAQNPTYAGAEPASHGPALTNLNYESVEPTSRGLAAQNPTYAGADPAYEEATHPGTQAVLIQQL